MKFWEIYFFDFFYFLPTLLLKKIKKSKNEKNSQIKKFYWTEIRTFYSDHHTQNCLC